MPERTWKAAFTEVFRTAARHKVASGVVAVLVVGTLVLLAWAGSRTAPLAGSASYGSTSDGTTVGAVIPAGEPPAAPFSLPVLSGSGTASPGTASPGAASPGAASGRISLASYSGKPLIINFFASWCAPCQQETPLLATFYRNEHGRVALVGLDENDVLAKALKFIRAKGVTYPVGWDPGVVAGSAYDVIALPQTFFLNAQHRIVYRVFGAVTTADLNTGIKRATADS
jgi:cytochrome c biogenesis protein CcmG, thiol:disulfide interchange protein DsbE